MSRILFADSEPHIQQLCLEELQDEGYEVKVTGKAAEVVRLAETFQPDMVIMEVLLPDMSGLEAGRMIKGANRKTRVTSDTRDVLDEGAAPAARNQARDIGISHLRH